MVVCALALGVATPAYAATLPGPAVGQPAPDFTLTTVDGKTVHLADYRGTTLVVNVWGSWCPPCRLETPDLVAEAKAGAAHSVAFLGVDTTESASAVRAFAATKGVPYPQVATTNDSAFARAYDIRAYPTTFVIDPNGVLRARHADNVLPRAQLRAYIAAAQRGESAPLATAFQAQLDALLDPAQYVFSGDAQSVRAAVAKANAAIAKANDLLDESMDDPSRDHDLIKTQTEEETLRAAAIAAFAPIAAGPADTASLARLRGDEAAALGNWRDADAFYQQALSAVPGDHASLAGQAYAADRLGDFTRVAAIDAQVAEKAPSPSAYIMLGRALAKTGDVAAAEGAFDRARTLAARIPIDVARTNLYYGRMEANAHNTVKARDAFGRALAAAERIPRSDPHAEWYVEQAQEGAVALGVVAGAPPSLSLAPWTGPDLPGSIASTVKYRLAVTGAPGTKLTLAASGLPKYWIASFCTDRVCSPFRVAVVVPPDGVKIIEFQVVPTTRTAAAAPTVRIDASAGSRRVATVGARVHG